MVKILPSNTQGTDVIPCHEAKSPHASWLKIQSIKQKQYYNTVNKSFKNDPHPKNLQKKKNKIGMLKECYFMSHLYHYI